jgi:hypothetical protein
MLKNICLKSSETWRIKAHKYFCLWRKSTVMMKYQDFSGYLMILNIRTSINIIQKIKKILLNVYLFISAREEYEVSVDRVQTVSDQVKAHLDLK